MRIEGGEGGGFRGSPCPPVLPARGCPPPPWRCRLPMVVRSIVGFARGRGGGRYLGGRGGHDDVLVLISEVWGGFSPEAMRLLGELAQARNDGVDLERANATWSTSSFTSYHGQLLSLAVQWGVAIEIERAIKKSARFC